jgi:hypothetical protein
VLLERKLAMVIQQIREGSMDFLMLRHEGDFFGFIERLLKDKGFKVLETSVCGLRQEKNRNPFALSFSG